MQGLGSGVLPEGVEHSLFCILAERMNLQTYCLLVQGASLILVIAEITSDSTEFNYLLVVGWPRTNVEKFKFWECPGGSMVRTPCFHWGAWVRSLVGPHTSQRSKKQKQI